MSTRVQKGGTIFKPVAKPRARLGSEVRQTSVAPDPRLSVVPSGANENRVDTSSVSVPAGDAADSMPPPTIIPRKPPQVAPSRVGITSSPERTRNTSESGAFPISVPSRSAARPPAVQTTPQAHVPPKPPVSTLSAAVPISMPPRDVASRSLPAQPIPPPVLADAPPLVHAPFTPPVAPLCGNIPVQNTADLDSHIDPALIKAVVTALRQADQSHLQEGIASQSNPLHFEPSGPPIDTTNQQSAPISNTTDTVAVPPPKPKRKRAKKAAEQADKPSGATEESAQVAASGTTDEDGEGSDAGEGKKRKRTSSGASRKRRSRGPSLPPYDPTVDPGEEIDPTAVTMADLCEDTGRGRVSSKAAMIMSNHAAWRAANREKRAMMRAKAEAKKYGRNLDEENTENVQTGQEAGQQDGEVPTSDPTETTSGTTGQSTSRAPSADPEGRKGDGFDYTQTLSTSRYNVQVRIGPNGETIIDETSLVVDRHAEEDTTEYTHIEESDTTKFVNSATYSKKLRGSRWSAEETDLFFDALSQFGENYELISLVLPGRDRKACKNKFKAEDKRNPGRITFCLKNRRPYDIATLSRMTGKDFSGPTPEIRAPTPLRMPDSDDVEPQAQVSPKVKKAQKTSTDEEIIGDVEEMEKEDIDEATLMA